MKTASDLKKLVTTIYRDTNIANGEIIDSIRNIDYSVLSMMDEVESEIASYEEDSKDIPIDVIIDALNKYNFVASDLLTAIHNYKLIQKYVSSELSLLDKLQKLIE